MIVLRSTTDAFVSLRFAIKIRWIVIDGLLSTKNGKNHDFVVIDERLYIYFPKDTDNMYPGEQSVNGNKRRLSAKFENPTNHALKFIFSRILSSQDYRRIKVFWT